MNVLACPMNVTFLQAAAGLTLTAAGFAAAIVLPALQVGLLIKCWRSPTEQARRWCVGLGGWHTLLGVGLLVLSGQAWSPTPLAALAAAPLVLGVLGLWHMSERAD